MSVKGQIRTQAANFKKAWRTGEVSTLASHGITPVEHDDDNEHRPGINDLRYVIQNNSDALSAGVPKFFMKRRGLQPSLGRSAIRRYRPK